MPADKDKELNEAVDGLMDHALDAMHRSDKSETLEAAIRRELLAAERRGKIEELKQTAKQWCPLCAQDESPLTELHNGQLVCWAHTDKEDGVVYPCRATWAYARIEELKAEAKP